MGKILQTGSIHLKFCKQMIALSPVCSSVAMLTEIYIYVCVCAFIGHFCGLHGHSVSLRKAHAGTAFLSCSRDTFSLRLLSHHLSEPSSFKGLEKFQSKTLAPLRLDK